MSILNQSLPSFKLDYSRDAMTQIIDHVERHYGVRLDYRKFYFDVSDVAHQKHNSSLKITSRTNDLSLQITIPFDRLDLSQLLEGVTLHDRFVSNVDTLYPLLDKLLESAREQSALPYSKILCSKDDFVDARIIRSDVTSGVTSAVEVRAARGSLIFTGHTKFNLTTCSTKPIIEKQNLVFISVPSISVTGKVVCLDTKGYNNQKFMFARNVILDTVTVFEIDRLYPISDSEFLITGNFQFQYTRTGSGGLVSTIKAEAIICDNRGYISSSPVGKPYAESTANKDVYQSNVDSPYKFGIEHNLVHKFDRNGCLLQTVGLDLPNDSTFVNLSVAGTKEEPIVCSYYSESPTTYVLEFFDSRLKALSGKIRVSSNKNIASLDCVFSTENCDERVILRPTFEKATTSNKLDVIVVHNGAVIIERHTENAIPLLELVLLDSEEDGVRTIVAEELYLFGLKGASQQALDTAFGSVVDATTPTVFTTQCLTFSTEKATSTSFMTTDELSGLTSVSALFTNIGSSIEKDNLVTPDRYFIKNVSGVKRISSDSILAICDIVSGDLVFGFGETIKDTIYFMKATDWEVEAFRLLTLNGVTGKDVIYLGD